MFCFCFKSDQRYETTAEVRGQLRFLEELDKLEKKRHEEVEREVLLRAAKVNNMTYLCYISISIESTRSCTIQ